MFHHVGPPPSQLEITRHVTELPLRGHSGNEHSAISSGYKVDDSDMEGLDIFYNVTLEGNGFVSADYALKSNPFEQFVQEPRQGSQEMLAVIEILIRGQSNTLGMNLLLNPLAGDDKIAGSEKEDAVDNARIGDGKAEFTGAGSENKDFWALNQQLFGQKIKEYGLRSFQVISMRVHSPQLQALLRSIILYYPSLNLKGNRIEIAYPFKPLFHYYNELLSLKVNFGGEKQKNITHTQRNALDGDTIHALDVLLAYLRPAYLSSLQPEESRYREGLASYRLLWFLFKPGSDVYAQVDGKLAAFVVEGVEDSISRGRDCIIITCWSLAYKSQRVMKIRTRYTIYDFIGEKEITSLAVFPCTYFDTTDNGNTKASLEALGAKYYEILKRVPAFRAYSGDTWDRQGKTVKTRYESDHRTYLNGGQVIIDQREQFLPFEEDPESSPDSVFHASCHQSSIAPDKVCGNDCIDPKSILALTKHQYFLLPRRINGFDLKSKKWLQFDIEFITDNTWLPEGDDPISKLVLAPSDIDIMKALCRAHGDQAPNVWSADFISGKGECQTFLLHGPPGTGKSFTVECLANYSRRPLLALTVSDIGTDERNMENNLRQWFAMATRWDALILIDEADVFLEKRTVADLHRNSLVSVFLRSMEYYTGMLFLTTNRIGYIDDAFLSRVSLALACDMLDDTKQKLIWRGFLTKLKKDRKDITLTGKAVTYLEALHLNEETKNIPWNGREIRNALQIAISLATHDAIEEAKENGKKVSKITVERDHFEKVVDRRKAFIKYRNSIRNKNEDQRAFAEGTRALTSKET